MQCLRKRAIETNKEQYEIVKRETKPQNEVNYYSDYIIMRKYF